MHAFARRVSSELTNIILVILVHFLNACVGQRLQIIPLAVDTKLSTATQGRGWKQDKFDEGENTIFFDNFWSCCCFSNPSIDNFWRVEKIYLAV